MRSNLENRRSTRRLFAAKIDADAKCIVRARTTAFRRGFVCGIATLTILATAVPLASPSMAADPSADRPLFDGRTFAGWTTLEGKPVAAGWEVAGGMIHLKPSSERSGHILSERDFGDMNLAFEWKIAPGGNSGVKYRVRNYEDYPRGCEYQILDDAKYVSEITPRTSAGSLYDLFEPILDKRVNPPGEFNAARIVLLGNRVEHWLNGRLIVSATIGSDEWKSRVAESKFSDLEDFALNARGKIMLTDHGHEVWYRGLELLPLPEKSPGANAPSLKVSQ